MNRTEPHSFTAPLVNAIIPALIMAMVGSLVFFVVNVLYRGPHYGRLCWVFGLFTLATVLVSRISITEGRDRGRMFGFALAGATMITGSTLVQFGEGSPIGLLLLPIFIAVVMWSTAQLTWDTTVMDESRDSSAMGLAERLRRRFIAGVRDETTLDNSNSPTDDETGEQQTKSDARAGNLIFALFNQASQRNTPGLWVFYFAIAAVPIFGIGQWFLPDQGANSVGWAGILFGVYMASAVTLLATTSFLGLQRYLAKRNIEMPDQIVSRWTLITFVTAAALFLIMFLLPKWNMHSGINDSLAWFNSRTRESSPWAFGKDGTESGESPNSTQKSNDGQQTNGGRGETGEGGQGKPQSGGNSKQQSNNSSSSKSENGKQQSGNQSSQSNKASSSSSSEQSKNNSNEKSSGDNQSNQSKASESEKASGQQSSQSDQRPRRNLPGSKPNSKAQSKQETNQQNEPTAGSESTNQQSRTLPGRNQSNQPRSPQTPSSPPNKPFDFSGIAKWLTYLVALVAIIVAAILFRDELAAMFRDLLSWFDRKKETPNDNGEPDFVTNQRHRKKERSFGEFQNPFTVQDSKHQLDRNLVIYTFQAMEALGCDARMPRDQDETPMEFASRITGRLRQLPADVAATMIDLYCKTIYSDYEPAGNDRQTLERTWVCMNQTYANLGHQSPL
ncbi:MAG: DUF4129 domain-containing protein [Pirellulaceae bacterium]